jgi:ribosomal protein L11 methyltransferase
VSDVPELAEPRYPYVLIDVAPEEADEWSSELFALGAQGVEERDETTLFKNSIPGKVTLVASFTTHDEAHEAIAALDPSFSPRLEEVVGDAWRDEWKKHFHPFPVCPGVIVRPPWEPYEPIGGEKVLELEPGRAFGTGLHETTSLVSHALQEHQSELAGARVLDVGCGSGILSLIALTLGASTARAIDIDPDAAAVTRENAARNGMQAQIEAGTTDVAAIDETYPLVLANIEARVLIPLAPAITARVAPGGLLVLSGILVPQKADVLAAYPRFTVVSAPEKGEWIALVLRA